MNNVYANFILNIDETTSTEVQSTNTPTTTQIPQGLLIIIIFNNKVICRTKYINRTNDKYSNNDNFKNHSHQSK